MDGLEWSSRCLRWLKEQGAEVNVKTDNGRTPMHLAAEGGHLDVMQWLNAEGLEINVKDNGGNTPLTLAIESGRTQVIEWLRENGATE